MTFDPKEARALVERLDGFTPGPWHVGNDAEEDDGFGYFVGGGGYCRANIVGPIVDTKSNAALIAAAPDLNRHLTAALDEIERLREALAWLDNVVETNCTPTGKPARIQDEQGHWHSGPAADICQKVLRGLQAVARAALKGAAQ